MIQNTRIKVLSKGKPTKGNYVLYWMQASQRARYNHALEYAIDSANSMNKPLVVYFGLTDAFPEANERHYHFMLEGLKEVRQSLQERGITMVIRHESPEKGAVALSKDAGMLITDRGYLRIHKLWRNYVATHAICPVIQVESDVIVPVETALAKEAYSAATLRPRIKAYLSNYLLPVEEHDLKVQSLQLGIASVDVSYIAKLLSTMTIERSIKPVAQLRGGSSKAETLLSAFISSYLDRYQELKNDPTAHCVSRMSPYLHFGHISPLYIALEILKTNSLDTDAYLEELIVRRELSMNYVNYNPHYDTFDGLPRWAQQALNEHAFDPREYTYSREELENSSTHDTYWNAAQREMMVTGYMHGYMRMYWGKKILEWNRSPVEAFNTAVTLNNKYQLDGRDPNSYTGIAWCFGKHDRPWARRPVFGTIRYMSAAGLKRHFDIEKYVSMVQAL